jgi:hypothetical protein
VSGVGGFEHVEVVRKFSLLNRIRSFALGLAVYARDTLGGTCERALPGKSAQGLHVDILCVSCVRPLALQTYVNGRIVQKF